MTPAQLARLIAAGGKDGGHGERNCPKCHKGYMAFHVVASSHAYACEKCKWVEFRDPPWPDRSGK